MRVIIVGASALGQHLAQRLISEGHAVILIERDQARAREMAETLDCTVINAEGTRPDILEKAEISSANAVVAVTGHDQDNIIIGLIARKSNVPEIILRTDDEQFLAVAKQLGFHHTINPSQIGSVIIADALRGVDTIELSTLIRGDVRFISVIVGEKLAGKGVAGIDLPKDSSSIGIYRKNDFWLASKNPILQVDDELIIITRNTYVKEICDRLCEQKTDIVI
jgi:trk system potassium uptake protein TrkA